MKIKTYKTISSEDMYKEYKDASNKEEVIKKYIEKEKDNGVSTRLDFFNLL